MTLEMELVEKYLQQGTHMKVSIKIINPMGRAYIDGLMEPFMKEIGLLESNMAMEDGRV